MALVCVSLLLAGVAGGIHAFPPPVSPDMEQVLNGSGLALSERLVLDMRPSGRRSQLPPQAVVVMSGLARGCMEQYIVHNALRDCISGRSAMVVVLQHYGANASVASTGRKSRRDELDFSFDACVDMFRQKVSGTACRLVLGQAWFKAGQSSWECPDHGLYPTLSRTIVQTLAVGRAYDWALALSPMARLFVCARLDAYFCVPSVDPAAVLPRTLVIGHRGAYLSDTEMGFVNDVYASMGSEAAASYFRAWKVWRPFNCTNACAAGSGSNLATAAVRITSECLGEAPLSRWLIRNGLLRGARMMVDRHFLYRLLARRGRKITAGFRARTCGACWPDCLPRLKQDNFTSVASTMCPMIRSAEQGAVNCMSANESSRKACLLRDMAASEPGAGICAGGAAAPGPGASCRVLRHVRCAPHRPGVLLPHRLRTADVVTMAGACEGHMLLDGVATTIQRMSAWQRSAWAAFFDGLGPGARARRSQLVVLGGSMLTGAGCSDGKSVARSPDCAYARRLVSSLSAAFGGSGPVLHNLATGGTTTAGILPVLPEVLRSPGAAAREGTPTVLLVDFSPNDELDIDVKKQSSQEELAAALESLVRFVMRQYPSVAILLLESFPGRTPHGNATISWAYERVSRAYGLAHLRYASVVRGWPRAWASSCSAIPRPESVRTHGPPCPAHPPWTTHQLIADTSLLSLAELGRGLCDSFPQPPQDDPVLRKHVAPAALLDRLATCETPRTAYMPTSPPANGVATPSGSKWTLYEDRPGKPGWITTGPINSTIQFRLRFGRQPRAAFSYLKGYDESLGVVELTVTDVRPGNGSAVSPDMERAWHTNRARLRARRVDGVQVTQTSVATLHMFRTVSQNYAMGTGWSPYFQGVIGFGLPPFAEATLNVRLVCERREGCPCSAGEPGPGCKFKILALVAC